MIARAVTIYTDLGGDVFAYAARVAEAAAHGVKVAILGTCASACTLWLSMPAGQVCLSPTAWLAFHRSAGPDAPAADAILWASYPASVRARLGSLGNVAWVRGMDVPEIAKCR